MEPSEHRVWRRRCGAKAGTIAIITGPDDAMKLVNNLLSGARRLLSLECLALAEKSGIDPGYGCPRFIGTRRREPEFTVQVDSRFHFSTHVIPDLDDVKTLTGVIRHNKLDLYGAAARVAPLTAGGQERHERDQA